MGEPYELLYIPIMGTSFKFLSCNPGLEATAQALESSTEGLQSDHKAWQKLWSKSHESVNSRNAITRGLGFRVYTAECK